MNFICKFSSFSMYIQSLAVYSCWIDLNKYSPYYYFVLGGIQFCNRIEPFLINSRRNCMGSSGASNPSGSRCLCCCCCHCNLIILYVGHNCSVFLLDFSCHGSAHFFSPSIRVDEESVGG